MPLSAVAAEGKKYNNRLAEGITKLNEKNLSAALQHFNAAIAADAKGVEAHYYLGVTQARANKDTVAEGHFLKALEIDRTFLPARLDLAVLYYQIGKDQEAMESLKIVEQIDPGRARVHYYQGLILRRNGSAAASQAKLEKAVSLDASLAGAIRFQSAISHYEAGAFDSAKIAFKDVLGLEPNRDLAEAARGFINKIDTAASGEKPWSFSMSLGLQYDDNVILDSGNAPLPAGIKEKDDLVGIVYLQGKYEWFKKDHWRSDVQYSFYQNLHFENSLDDFNIQDHHLSLSGYRQFGMNEAGLIYTLQYATLGGEDYMTAHSIGPKFLWMHSDLHFTEIDYRYGMKDFDDISPLFRGNGERDVDTHQLGFSHTHLFGEKGKLYGGYRFEKEDAGSSAAEDDWTYDGHEIKVGLVLPPWKEWIFSLEASGTRRDYSNPNQQDITKSREDDDLLFIAVLSHPMTEHTHISAQYLYQQNDSNISIYDYDRSIVGLVVTAAY
ncbi:MAG: tetratricopeptide repeat protein [Nitrospirota bacterium]|nr:tetratricopeptide repeat protein [Nitrospirota bacterium]